MRLGSCKSHVTRVYLFPLPPPSLKMDLAGISEYLDKLKELFSDPVPVVDSEQRCVLHKWVGALVIMLLSHTPQKWRLSVGVQLFRATLGS